MRRAFRPYVTAGVVIVGAGLLAAPVVAPSAHQTQSRAVKLAAGPDEIAYIMGGSGHPIPPSDYLAGVDSQYIQHLYPGYTSEPLFYPAGAEGGYTGPESLPMDESSEQGLTILNDTIMRNLAEGNSVTVFGHSQSSTIISEELANLDAGNTGGLGPAPSPDQLHVIMTGDPSNPDGGFLSRFPGLNLVSEGTPYGSVTPPDTDYSTDVYTLEYDGVGDFPKYTLNLLSDLNAIMGMQYIHPYANYINPDNVDNAFLLPGSAELTGEGATNYWMMPTDTLPLLIPLQNIPVIGQPLYDLLEPDMRILVNLGYGSIDEGWDQGPANVASSIGLFPDVDPNEVMDALAKGAQQGWDAFESDLSQMTPSSVLNELTASASSAADTAPDVTTPTDPMAALTDIVHTLTGASTTIYGYLLPMANIVNDGLTSIPIYDLNLFTQGLQDGDLMNAFGMPLAANTALYPELGMGLSGDFQAIFATIDHAADQIGADFMGLF